MQAPAITTALAGIRRHEQMDVARAHRLGAASPVSGPAPAAEVTIRLSRPDDEPALARLAQLDGRGDRPAGDVLVAVVGGAIVAARGLRGGAVSDPFRTGPEVMALLDVRARQLAGRPSRALRARTPRRTMPVLRVGGAR